MKQTKFCLGKLGPTQLGGCANSNPINLDDASLELVESAETLGVNLIDQNIRRIQTLINIYLKLAVLYLLLNLKTLLAVDSM